MPSIAERISKRLPHALKRAGDRVTLLAASGIQRDTYALLQDPYASVELADRILLESSNPVFLVQSDVVAELSLTRNDELYHYRNQQRYRIVETMPSSNGFTRLRVIEATA